MVIEVMLQNGILVAKKKGHISMRLQMFLLV